MEPKEPKEPKEPPEPLDPMSGRWEQLSKCPTCGAEMQREPNVGERVGLFYRCSAHGRFRYSWDLDRLEAVGDHE